jgi:poly(3-hydroxybutyrate) depolymerase
MLMSSVAIADKAPCKSCTLDVPAKADKPTPLIVLLHGDRQAASTLATWWKKAALARGWAVLSLQCPKDKGCKDSYWQWDGEPQWVFDQVAAVPKIDPAHIYLVGWSGGASWMGYRAQAWSSVFAAIVIHGGGVPPRDEGCTKLPVYFLVGDKNPLHYIAVQLRDYFDACKTDVTWDLVPKADHEGEENALAKKREGILDWLAARARESAKQGSGAP